MINKKLMMCFMLAMSMYGVFYGAGSARPSFYAQDPLVLKSIIHNAALELGFINYQIRRNQSNVQQERSYFEQPDAVDRIRKQLNELDVKKGNCEYNMHTAITAINYGFPMRHQKQKIQDFINACNDYVELRKKICRLYNDLQVIYKEATRKSGNDSTRKAYNQLFQLHQKRQELHEKQGSIILNVADYAKSQLSLNRRQRRKQDRHEYIQWKRIQRQ